MTVHDLYVQMIHLVGVHLRIAVVVHTFHLAHGLGSEPIHTFNLAHGFGTEPNRRRTICSKPTLSWNAHLTPLAPPTPCDHVDRVIPIFASSFFPSKTRPMPDFLEEGAISCGTREKPSGTSIRSLCSTPQIKRTPVFRYLTFQPPSVFFEPGEGNPHTPNICSVPPISK